MKITKDYIQKYKEIAEEKGIKVSDEKAEESLRALVEFIKTIIDHNLNKKD